MKLLLILDIQQILQQYFFLGILSFQAYPQIKSNRSMSLKQLK